MLPTNLGIVGNMRGQITLLTWLMRSVSQIRSRVTLNAVNKVRLMDLFLTLVLPHAPYCTVCLIKDIISEIDHSAKTMTNCLYMSSIEVVISNTLISDLAGRVFQTEDFVKSM